MDFNPSVSRFSYEWGEKELEQRAEEVVSLVPIDNDFFRKGCVTQYYPAGTARGSIKNLYYRYSWNENGTLFHMHIPGGNTHNPIAHQHCAQVKSAIAQGKTQSEITQLIRSWRRVRELRTVDLPTLSEGLSTTNLSFYDLSDRQQSRIKSRLSKFQSDSFVNCWEWLGAKQPAGYGKINVRVFGKQKILRVHRVSFEIMMNRAIPQGFHVLHKCDNPSCFNPKHLFLGTNAMNMADKVEKGRQAKGERTGRARLTACQVIEIKNKLKGPEKISQQAIANLYGVGRTTISDIKNGLRWKHLKEQ